jgi:hypothetical protein
MESGVYEPAVMEMDAPVFHSAADMIAHHSGAPDIGQGAASAGKAMEALH